MELRGLPIWLRFQVQPLFGTHHHHLMLTSQFSVPSRTSRTPLKMTRKQFDMGRNQRTANTFQLCMYRDLIVCHFAHPSVPIQWAFRGRAPSFAVSHVVAAVSGCLFIVAPVATPRCTTSRVFRLPTVIQHTCAYFCNWLHVANHRYIHSHDTRSSPSNVIRNSYDEVVQNQMLICLNLSNHHTKRWSNSISTAPSANYLQNISSSLLPIRQLAAAMQL